MIASLFLARIALQTQYDSRELVFIVFYQKYLLTYLSIELEGLKAIQLIDIKHYNLSLHVSTISFQSITITCTGVFILETNKIGCNRLLITVHSSPIH